jgi:Uncharacterized conserved protein (some members contain a von Willebrand factor type A (vWA) domain)
MTRQLAQEGEQGYWIDVDASEDVWNEKAFEQMCSLVCTLGVDLYHQGRLEGMWIPGNGWMAVRSVGDLHECFNAMALLQASLEPYHGHVRPFHRNRMHFKPNGEDAVAIYIDENRAGQTDN